VRLLTCLRTIEMTSNCRFHYKAKMMLFISEQSIWVHQQVNQLESYSTQVLNTWLLPVFSVMMRQPETISLRNTIHFQVVSLLETKCIKDVKLWLTTCISQIQIKFFQRPHQNLHTVQPNSKVSSGKIIPVSNHLRELLIMLLHWN